MVDVSDPSFDQEDPSAVADRELAVLARLSETIAAADGAGTPLKRVLDQLLDYLGAPAGVVLRVDDSTAEPRPEAVRGLSPQATTCVAALVGDAFAERRLTGEPIWLIDSGDGDRPVVCGGVTSVAAVPVRAGQQLLAVCLIMGGDASLLAMARRPFLEAAALQLGLALKNSRLIAVARQRGEEIAAVQQANRALTSSLDPFEAMQTIISASIQLTRSHSGAIALVDAESETLEYVAYANAPPETNLRIGSRLPLHKTLAGRCALSGEPLIVGDLTLLPAYEQGIRQAMPGFRSLLCLPLLVHKRVIGVLALTHREPNFYRQEHADLLCGLCSQAAAAIENARLYRDSQDHLARLSATYRMAQALSSTFELQSVIEAVVADATQQTSFPIAALALMQPRTLTFDFPVTVGMPEAFRRLIDGIPINSPYLEGSALQIAMNSHRPALVEDVAADPGTEPVREAMLNAGLAAYVCMPLVAKGRFQGALFVYDERPRPDAASDLPYLTALADQAAIAIANARLYESMEESLHQTRALQRVTSALAASLDLEELLRLAIASAVQLFGADRAGIYMYDNDSHEVRCAASYGLSDEYLRAVQEAYRNAGGPTEMKDYLYIADAQKRPRPPLSREAAKREGFRSMLFASLRFREERVGTFVLYHNNVRHYSETEIGLARTLAEQVGIAVEHARLFEQTRRLAVVEERNRLARELHDSVSQSLFSMSLMAQALPMLMVKDENGARERVERLGELARGALAEMRSLIFELRPAALEEEGLVQAIRKNLAAFQSREAIDVQVQITGRERRLSLAIEEALFRITQETLNNVAKHARASSVTISLAFGDETIALCVRDDGAGFEAGGPSERKGGFGLTSMRQRAEMLDGSFHVRSSPGAGTEVLVEIPAPLTASVGGEREKDGDYDGPGAG